MPSRSGDIRAVRCACLLAFALAAGGCIVQGNKCSPNQVEYDGQVEICLCAPGFVTDSDGTGCVACGANETSSYNKCVCNPGYGRASEAEACSPMETKAACESDVDCATPAPHCVKTDTSPGYCTSTGCSANKDCLAGWSCERTATARYCARPPSGLGNSCQSNDDCASYDARYCDSLISHTCLLTGCATGAAKCPNEWLCCDYSALLGAALSICLSPAVQVGGTCPQGGSVVSP